MIENISGGGRKILCLALLATAALFTTTDRCDAQTGGPSAASTALQRSAVMTPSIPQVEPSDPSTQGSLWQRGPKRRVLLRKAKNRAPIKKHDIILVVVTENDSASNDARLDTQRRLELEQTIDAFIRFSGHKLKPDFSPQPEIEMQNQRRLQATGRTDRRDNFRLRVAAKVVDVRENGNLIIEASEEKTINDETTKVALTGEIRTADVGDDYTISSDRVASMKLHYHGSGPVSNNSGESWLSWIVDRIWPF